MTKKHFKTLAAAMNKTMPSSDNLTKYDLWLRECGRLAAMCMETNPRFDAKRFLDACIGK